MSADVGYIKEYHCHSKYLNCSGNGLILPIFEECHWSLGVLQTLYFLGLVYCFLGVAIIADVFMGSIEKITSKTRKVSSLFLVFESSCFFVYGQFVVRVEKNIWWRNFCRFNYMSISLIRNLLKSMDACFWIFELSLALLLSKFNDF